MTKFSLNTNKDKRLVNKVSLDDVLDSPGKTLDEIIEEKKEVSSFSWDDPKLSKKDRDKFLWSMKKEYYLKLEWLAEELGHSKSRILEDIVYLIMDRKIKSIVGD